MTDTRSRAWCFTSFSQSEAEHIHEALAYQYIIVGKEVCPTTGKLHFQGYIYFKNARSFESLKKKFHCIHWEARKGTHAQARDYCKKDGAWWEFGTEPEKTGGNGCEEKASKNKRLREEPLTSLVENGEINIMDVKRLKQARDILDTEYGMYDHSEVRGIWLYGPPGTGKSHKARSEYGDVFFVKAQNKWFDGYKGEETIILDDLDKQGSCLGHYLKIWADKYRCTGEVKGGTVPLRHKRFVVTSNYMPEDLWPEDKEMQHAVERRFQFQKHSIKYM